MADELAEDEVPAQEPVPMLSEELQEMARQVRAVLDGWVLRMTATVSAGRAATTVARMATARAIAELRHLTAPDPGDASAAPVADYLRRARSTLSQAAHDIERNRYSLHVMHHQIERLNELVDKILPGERIPQDGETAVADEGSGSPAGGADDRGADGEIPTR